MIELFGLTIAWETIAFTVAFVASEVIGISPMKENSVASMLKSLIDRMKPAREEDEKVAEVRKATDDLLAALKRLGDWLIMAKRASESSFDELHQLLTQEFLQRIKEEKATTADLRAAIDWLKANNITGVAAEGSPLASLAGVLPELTFEDVQGAL